jgi:8-oxo-dGTP pyrophosphatase MutT (NUDIX family)
MADDVRIKFRASGCFCLFEDRVLLMQRNGLKPFGLHWSIPTGKIEDDESPSECMSRELGEELNVDVDEGNLALIADFVVDAAPDDRFRYLTYVTRFNTTRGLTPRLEEVHKIEWRRLDQVAKRKVVPYFYNTLNALMDWEIGGSTQVGAFPEPEAHRVDRRRVTEYRARRGHTAQEEDAGRP